jgi:pimeloyl-ACP methyl ester carboxylesterase
MSTQQTAVTQYVTANGIKYAYRTLGLPATDKLIPLVLLMHFRGSIDHWDPALINGLAATRPIIIFDNAGLGKSGGEVADNFTDWAGHAITVVQALGFRKIDLLGFSMGGMAAQLFALNTQEQGLVRRLILAGTGPSTGEGTAGGELAPFQQFASAETKEELKAAYLDTLFPVTEEGIAAGEAWWKRINERTEDRSSYLDQAGTARQTSAVLKYLGAEHSTTYERLPGLNIPVFVTNGNDDILVPTVNSWVLFKLLPDAHLHLYPKSGHGFLFQYHELFVAHVNQFLGQ